MRLYLLALLILLGTPVMAEELAWRTPMTYTFDEVEVYIFNWELTRDRKTILVHAKLRNKGREAIYCRWKEWLEYETPEGDRFGSNFDALVDRNGAGLTRTIGDFQLQPREKARITMPFLINREQLPGRFVLPGEKKSVLVK